ncbi:MAG: MnmC family methyltransferase [Cyanobacteriota bacterium]|nr:MnmC family methyltransferase [Cyanobacteriota bacterium]
MKFSPHPTEDGSSTFFSDTFNQLFHSHHGAKQEAQCKFVEPTQLAERARNPQLRLLDICYGLGYNSAAALSAIWQVNPYCRVELIGLEFDRHVPQAAISEGLLSQWPAEIETLLAQLATSGNLRTEKLNAKLLIGDARQTIQHVQNLGFLADAIFLDPFSPPSCPQLWTVEFLAQVARCAHESAKLATYSCSATVRAALRDAGWHLGSTSPVGRRTPGTVASLQPSGLPPLSPKEYEHLQTRAAVPYRDPTLADAPDRILQRRHTEQQTSSLEPTTHWKKRWHGSRR